MKIIIIVLWSLLIILILICFFFFYIKRKKKKEIGKITQYFGHIGVAVVELTGKLKVGNRIRIKGTTTDFEQKVDSMQIKHKQVSKAKKGDTIRMKVAARVREHDKVYVI